MRFKHRSIISLSILLMFIADGFNTALLYLDLPIWRVSVIVRFLIQAYFLFLLFRTHQGRNVYLSIFFFYIVFIIGSWATFDSYEQYNWGDNFTAINKMLFFFICWETFRLYFRTDAERSLLFKLFEVVVLVQATTVLFSFVFHLDIFSSYPEGSRFGYKGLVPALNEVSGFFLIAFFYFLWQIVYKQRRVFLLIATTVAGMFTGAKVALALVVILLVYLVKWLFLLCVRPRKIYLAIGTAVGVLLAAALVEHNYLLSRLEPSITYFSYFAVKQSRSTLSLFFSGRDIQVHYFFSEIFPRFNLVNYLFGGQDLSFFSTETDLVDVFARLGLLGGSVFYFLYVSALLGEIKAIPFIRLLFVTVWLGVSITAGHLVFSAVNAAYLAILLLVFSPSELSVNRKQLAWQTSQPLRFPKSENTLSSAPAGKTCSSLGTNTL